MNHIVLLGDSIFDNKSMFAAGLMSSLICGNKCLKGGKSLLCAVDGNVVENVQTQILGLPDDVTHLFISAGGNNALLNADILEMNVSSSAEVFDRTCGFSKRV